MQWNKIDALMQEGVKKEIFPGAVLLVSLDGKIRHLQSYGHSSLTRQMRKTQVETSFDLASLTKPLATSLAVMILISQGRLHLTSSLNKIFLDSNTKIPEDKKQITVRHLLSHTSGYPAYRPYYKKLERFPKSLRWEKLWEILLSEPLLSAPGKKTCYSDPGFLILQKIVEHTSQKSLDLFLAKEVYAPLRIESFEYSPRQTKTNAGDFERYAETEMCPWRKRRLLGEVHDENSYVIGGVAGHAGLFGTAQDIYRLLSMLYDLYRGKPGILTLKPEVVHTFWSRQNITRESSWALGFDMPSRNHSSSGKYFSPNSIGHLGFTGPSFWFDIDVNLLVILLNNRIYYGRETSKIKEFRPMIHDKIRELLGLT